MELPGKALGQLPAIAGMLENCGAQRAGGMQDRDLIGKLKERRGNGEIVQVLVEPQVEIATMASSGKKSIILSSTLARQP